MVSLRIRKTARGALYAHVVNQTLPPDAEPYKDETVGYMRPNAGTIREIDRRTRDGIPIYVVMKGGFQLATRDYKPVK